MRRALLTRTFAVPPSIPTALSATGGKNQITAQWSLPQFPGSSPITSYTVQLSVAGDSVVVGTYQIGFGNYVMNIDNLAPETNYYVRVRAESAAGPGDWAGPYTVQTDPMLTIGNDTDSSFNLSTIGGRLYVAYGTSFAAASRNGKITKLEYRRGGTGAFRICLFSRVTSTTFKVKAYTPQLSASSSVVRETVDWDVAEGDVLGIFAASTSGITALGSYNISSTTIYQSSSSVSLPTAGNTYACSLVSTGRSVAVYGTEV